MDSTALVMFRNTVMYSGNDIFIKPFCDFFDINYENQRRVINSDRLLQKWSTKKSSSLQFGDKYVRVLLTKKGFLRWIQQLKINIVRKDLQEKLAIYQEYIFDYLYGSFEKEEEIKKVVVRRNRLKSLKTKVESELKAMNDKIEDYLNGKVTVIEIPFTGNISLDGENSNFADKKVEDVEFEIENN